MTVKDIIIKTTAVLKDAGIESASLDCRLLLCKFLGVDKVYLITNSDREIDDLSEFDALVKRRLNHEPMQYILNHAEFMGLDFYVDENVLIPRPDTEILVEKVISHFGETSFEFLDIGTGSGCIPISILANCKNARGISADISEKAIDVAKKNAESNKVTERLDFINIDILNDFPERKFDCIVSNPPYIESEVVETLMPDVREFEPHLALDGGADGLTFYRRIADKGYDSLKDGGLLAFEIGYNQGESVSRIMNEKGYRNTEVIKDIAGNDRVVVGTK